MLQAKPSISGKQEQEQNSPNLGPPFSQALYTFDNNLTNFLSTLGYCFCKDNPDREVDVRPDYFKNVLDLCPRNEINRYSSLVKHKYVDFLPNLCLFNKVPV